MTKTLLAVAFFGLTAVGLAGCGSGDDSPSEIAGKMCDKMNSCGLLEPSGMTLSQCKEMAAESSKGEEVTDAEVDAAKACLGKSCTEFMTCIEDM